MKRALLLGGLIVAMTSGRAASAAEIALIAPGGIRAPFEQLIPEFERSTGNKVIATYGSGGGTKNRVLQGEAFDVPIVQPPYANVLASGNVVAGTETPLARVAVGLAVRAGTAKPDISSAAAVRNVLLAARAIAYPDPAAGAAAGVSFTATLQKLGIADAVRAKTIVARSGADAMAKLATNEVDIGLTFISEMVAQPGIELVGALPRDIAPPTAFVAFVSSHAMNPDAANALIRFLAAPEAAAIYRARGMEPGR